MEGHRLIALDMDGTVTQHKSQLEPENRAALDRLRQNYRIVMIGAGSCMRIHNQLGQYPIDVVGCYGMEFSHWSEAEKRLIIDTAEKVRIPDREEMIRRAAVIREKYGYTQFAGDSVEFHDSGMMTFALLGTAAKIEDKLAFDPDRKKRRVFYREVCEAYPEYTVFIGGSSSFDIVPHPYDKKYALDLYCSLNQIHHSDVTYFGDDYEPGGNDYQVAVSDYRFIKVDNYRDFAKKSAFLLKEFSD